MGAPLGSLMCPSQVMSMSTVKTDCWGEGTWLASPPSQAGQSQPLETEQDGWQRGPQPWRGSWVLHPQWTGHRECIHTLPPVPEFQESWGLVGGGGGAT